jgi:hypothetical protein
MNERTAQTGIAAAACGALALIGFVLTSQVEAFAPCRVLYRLPQAVQDSLACRMHSAIGLVSLMFVFAALAVGLAAAFMLLARRGDRGPRS